MRYLLFASLIVILSGCGNVYRKLIPENGSSADLNKFRPAFTTTLYKAKVNVVGRYLSGLLMIKQMPDSSNRLLFSSEMGLKFFDFEFDRNGKFRVIYIIKQMNRKAVIKTLKKDFELVMVRPGNENRVRVKKDKAGIYYIFPNGKGYYTYITSEDRSSIRSMHRASKSKVVAEAQIFNLESGEPDSIFVRHLGFRMDIALKNLKIKN